MGRRMIRDMRHPTRREERCAVGEHEFVLAVTWHATPEQWTAELQISDGREETLGMPLALELDVAAAGSVLLYSAVTLQDLKRLSEDALLQLGRAYLLRKHGEEASGDVDGAEAHS